MSHIEIALSQYGVSELQSGDNPTILNYSKESGIEGVQNDEVSWCSIFVNWVCYKAGLTRSMSPSARSWLTFGTETKTPEIGDIVVMWRESPQSWKGHVGFFISYSQDRHFINVLGGNQGNRVCIQSFSVEQILQFRKLI